MDRILVAIDHGKGSVWAAVHAFNLAKRIKAKVFFLLIIDSSHIGSEKQRISQIEAAMKARIEPLIEEGLSEGIPIDYYISHGRYENELVKFVKENRITILVVGSPAGHSKHPGDFNDLIEKIRHRIDCCIEVVHEKGSKTTKI